MRGCSGKIRIGDCQLVEAQRSTLRQYATLRLMGIPASRAVAVVRENLVGERFYGLLAICLGCTSILIRSKRELLNYDRPASL